MFQIEQELLDLGCGSLIVPLISDVLDGERMQGIFDRFRPQLVFHAAAHKHVPLMEHQPYEAFRNNTIGTKQLAKLAIEFGVERFVFISTDKAINPTNAHGCDKAAGRAIPSGAPAAQRHTYKVHVRAVWQCLRVVR